VEADWWLGLACVGGPILVLVLWIVFIEREDS
jgi:hypothetical protein